MDAGTAGAAPATTKKVAAKKAAPKKAGAAPKMAARKTAAATAPRKAPARKKIVIEDVVETAPEPADNNPMLQLVLDGLDNMKAEETVTIDLRGRSAFSDFMVITSGRSNRHVGAVAENVVKAIKESGQKSVHVEGMGNCDWVLIDTGDVIVHVFRPEVREFYNLERLWAQNASSAQSA